MTNTTEAKPELLIRMQSTPNPQALKFILNQPVKRMGKATYDSLEETYGNVMAYSLMQIEGAIQVHMFENVITATFKEGVDPYEKVEGDKKEARKESPPEFQKIEEILDRTIRPGLQADGGDLEIVRLTGKVLEIKYQGACGTCPSSTAGTLQAIEGILQQEYDPEISIQLADG